MKLYSVVQIPCLAETMCWHDAFSLQQFSQFLGPLSIVTVRSPTGLSIRQALWLLPLPLNLVTWLYASLKLTKRAGTLGAVAGVVFG
jgi:hypothetical protein